MIEELLAELATEGWHVHRLAALAGEGELVILTHPDHFLPLQAMGPLEEIVPLLHADALRPAGAGDLLTVRYPGVPRTVEEPPPLFDRQLSLLELVAA